MSASQPRPFLLPGPFSAGNSPEMGVGYHATCHADVLIFDAPMIWAWQWLYYGGGGVDTRAGENGGLSAADPAFFAGIFYKKRLTQQVLTIMTLFTYIVNTKKMDEIIALLSST